MCNWLVAGWVKLEMVLKFPNLISRQGLWLAAMFSECLGVEQKLMAIHFLQLDRRPLSFQLLFSSRARGSISFRKPELV